MNFRSHLRFTIIFCNINERNQSECQAHSEKDSTDEAGKVLLPWQGAHAEQTCCYQ